MAGTEGIVWVHVPFSLSIPFSLSDLSQIKKCLGSFSSDSDTYLKEFKYLTLFYYLIWHDIYIISSSTLLLEEKELVWQSSQPHAEEIHQTDDTKPVSSVEFQGTQLGLPGWASGDKQPVIIW